MMLTMWPWLEPRTDQSGYGVYQGMEHPVNGAPWRRAEELRCSRLPGVMGAATKSVEDSAADCTVGGGESVGERELCCQRA